jgi:hypothetical protein
MSKVERSVQNRLKPDPVVALQGKTIRQPADIDLSR